MHQYVHIPKDTLLRLGATFLANEYRQKQIYQELKERILPALEGHVSPVVLLKGSALAYAIYPHPALRPMGDVDVLVQEDQLTDAVQRLVAIGYSNSTQKLGEMTGGLAHHVHLVASRPIPLDFEVHRTIMLSSSDFSRVPGIDWFWQNLEFDSVDAGFPICRFNPTAQLLHLAVHLVQQHGEAQMSLLKYYDLHKLIEKYGKQIDWQTLLLQAKKLNRITALFTALKGSILRFDTNIDPQFMASLQSEIVDDLITAEVNWKSRPESTGSTTKVYSANVWFHLKSPQSLVVRMRYFQEMLLPTPQFIRSRYRPKPAWIWPLFYIIRWLRVFPYGWYWLKMMFSR